MSHRDMGDMKLDPGKVDWCLLPKQEDQAQP